MWMLCDAHLVFSQQFALPERVGNVMNGQAEVVGASLKMQSFGLLQKLATQLPLELEDLLQYCDKKKKVVRFHQDSTLGFWFLKIDCCNCCNLYNTGEKKVQRCVFLWTGIALVDLSITPSPSSYSSSPVGMQAPMSHLEDTVSCPISRKLNCMLLNWMQRLCIQALFEYRTISVFSIVHRTGHLMIDLLFCFSKLLFV